MIRVQAEGVPAMRRAWQDTGPRADVASGMGRVVKEGTRVYSTETGGFCPGCRRKLVRCVCRKPPSTPGTGGDGVVRLHRETRGRRGAGVTRVTGLDLDAGALADLARLLRKHCGVGGAVKGGVIELQGEQRQRIKPLLEARGHIVKIAGG